MLVMKFRLGQCQKSERTAVTIFLKLCTILVIKNVRKVTEPDFPKKIWFIHKVRKRGQNDVSYEIPARAVSKVKENGSNDFFETLHNVRHQKCKKSDTAGLSKKYPVFQKITDK